MTTNHKVIDLFAGTGGMRLAFERHGCECVFSCEYDKKAQETYKANFGETPRGDIRELDIATIPNHDITLAGFPCQPFSLAGVSKKNSLGRKHGFEDAKQGNLFYYLADIIKEKQPKAFLLENVRNLLSHDKKKTFAVIEKTLKEIGYEIDHHVQDASHYVPQSRKRIFIVGLRKDLHKGGDFKFDFPEPSGTHHIKDILEPAAEVPAKYILTDKLWNYLQNYAIKHREAGNGFGFGLVDPTAETAVTRTLSARYHKDGSEILIKMPTGNPRRLTPRECARLMGFPDTFEIKVSDTAAYKQFGNAVVVPVVADIAKQMVAMLDQILKSREKSKTVSKKKNQKRR